MNDIPIPIHRHNSVRGDRRLDADHVAIIARQDDALAQATGKR
jgi:hypothetical protein